MVQVGEWHPARRPGVDPIFLAHSEFLAHCDPTIGSRRQETFDLIDGEAHRAILPDVAGLVVIDDFWDIRAFDPPGLRSRRGPGDEASPEWVRSSRLSGAQPIVSQHDLEGPK
jgi:hypothetical protein